MTQLARIPAAAAPGGTPPHRRRMSGWFAKPCAALVRSWRSQTELWERWYVAPYKDDGPLRWQRRDGTWVLDGAELPGRADRKGNR